MITPEQHAQIIGNSVKAELITKYLKGASEHGGHIKDLTPLQLVEMALEEAIDQYVYLYTLKEALNDSLQP